MTRLTQAQWESYLLLALDRMTGDKTATEQLMERWKKHINFAYSSGKMPIDTAMDVFGKHVRQVQKDLEKRLRKG